MLAKKEKFNREDFSKIKKHKFRKMPCNIGVFSIYDGLHWNKKQIIVSKKIAKTAVLRNKLKRIFMNFVRTSPLLQNKTLVFYPNKIFSKKDLENCFLLIGR